MRHKVFGRKLGRSTGTRKALLGSLASAVLVNGSATTTLAKAKFAASYIEKLITSAKKNKLEKKRHLATILSNQAFSRLINEIGPGFATKSGGYTKITKIGKRTGDAALVSKIELLALDQSKPTKKDKKSFSRKS